MRRVKSKPTAKPAQVSVLKGWNQIADFLGQPISVVQRWGRTGMPVKRQGRFVTAVPDELNTWLGAKLEVSHFTSLPRR